MIILKIICVILSMLLAAWSGYKLYKHRSYDKFENRAMACELAFWCIWVILNLFNLFA